MNLLERLVELSPGMEIWWDSSPLIFERWCVEVLGRAPLEKRKVLQGYFNRMQNPSQPLDQLIKGVTTNPSLSLQAIQKDPEFWNEYTGGLLHQNPDCDRVHIFWLLYRAMVKRGADMLMPLFESSRYRAGFVSAQVDPRLAFNREGMITQAQELAALSPNVMVKIPGTREGYEVIEALTAQGIPTNNTAAFVLSQLLDCAQTVQKGLQRAEAAGVDLSRWRSVITMMESRFSDLGELRQEAVQNGVELTEADVRLAELAIFKKAYRSLKRERLPSKLLSCSLRTGPVVDGVIRVWHLEEKTGADIVVTCPPAFIEQVLLLPDQDRIELQAGRIDRDIPEEVLEKLLKVPYFERSYREDGYSRPEYNTLKAMKKTIEGFSRDTERMEQFTESCRRQSIA